MVRSPPKNIIPPKQTPRFISIPIDVTRPIPPRPMPSPKSKPRFRPRLRRKKYKRKKFNIFDNWGF